jgi:hypothetical protein
MYKNERKKWMEQLRQSLFTIDDARVQLINSDFYSIINIKLLWFNKHEVTLEEEIEQTLDRMELNEEDEYDSENEEEFDEENCFKRPDEESS